MNEPLEDGMWQQQSSFKGYAGFWLRLAAIIIDGVAVTIVLYALMALGLGALFVSNPDIMDSGGEALFADDDAMNAFMAGYFGIVGLSLIGNWLYFALMESSKYQGTLGKMAVSIKVTDLQGERISFLRATGRYFGKMVSALILYIGFFMAGFTERKQGLHDMMASALVVKK